MTPPSGARAPVRPDRRTWLIAAVVVLMVLVLLLFGLSRCGNDQTDATRVSPASTASSVDSAATGRLTAGDTVLVPRATGAAGDDLSPYIGRRAVGSAISVLSVPADEGFWVGTSPLDRTWVQLAGAGESPFHVRAGQKVSFTGTVVAHGSDYPSQVGVTALEGASQLVAEHAHIEVPRTALVTASS